MNRIIYLFRVIQKLILTPERWARKIGVNIGKDNLIGKNHWSSEPYLITVGNHCQLTDCHIHTHGGGNIIRERYPDFDMFGRVIIKDWVYIGTGSQIMPGVTIEDHVLVAAGSIVTKSVPAGCIVAGNPAKIIGTVNDYIDRNLRWNLHTKGMSSKQKKEFLLSQSERDFIRKAFLKD